MGSDRQLELANLRLVLYSLFLELRVLQLECLLKFLDPLHGYA